MSRPVKTMKDELDDAKEIIRKQAQQINVQHKEIRKIKQDNDAAEKIRTEIYGLKAYTPDPPTWIVEQRDAKLPGVPMTIWSDLHAGEVVKPHQVGGVNEFNHKVLEQRMVRLVETTVDLAVHHMVNPKYPGIVVMLGGDMITGMIHDDLRESNEGPVQVSLLKVQNLLIAALTAMADQFGKVFVPCVVGNHGRDTLKPRTKNAVFQSYEWNLYCQLELYFRNDKRIQFFIPEETDAYFKVLGHRFLLTHGDNLGVKGGDGIIGVLGPMARGAIKVGRSEAQIGRDFDTIVIGHYHTFVPRSDAMPLLANGAVIGYNEYARLRLRVPYSRPSQALWFMHQKHGFTATWPVYLDKKRKAIDNGQWVTWQQQEKTV